MDSPLKLSRRRRRGRWLRRALLLSLFAGAAAAGTAAGLWAFYSEDVPPVDQLDKYRPSVITRVYAADGQVIGQFAQEHRIVISFEQIPQRLREAIIAVEDADFYSHSGINVKGVVRAAVENARQGKWAQGGSSLTQQLAKLLFLTPEKSLERKAKEAVVALRIERRYSKDEILTLYLNQIYLGHNRYGVEAAARFYFGKHATELALDEAALLAGLPQRPNAYSPYRDPAAALERRNHVLDRMAAEGFVTAAEAEEAKRRPIVLQELESDDIALAPYFVEEVRQFLEQSYGEETLYHDGLHVHTTLEPRVQAIADEALRQGLLELDRRQGWRGPAVNVLRDQPGTPLPAWSDPGWAEPPRPGMLVRGLVTAVGPGRMRVRVGDRTAEVTRPPEWVRRGSVDELYRVGDVGLFRVTAVDAVPPALRLAAEHEPEVEGAVVVLDVRTGQIKAMTGGWDFRRSKFNRAVQARRQTGSSFKPILYAAALANGFTPADSLFDEPIAITDPWTGKVYAPENYSHSYYGLTTIRQALEESRNPVSVQLLQRVGAHTVIELAQRLGLTTRLDPYPSLALGAFEESLLEMTSAFTAFADLGVVHQPYLITRIEDRDGVVLYRKNPIAVQALAPEVAFVTNYVMQGVIQRGTAAKARALGRPLAGKTGTTDDFTDAWFIGHSPSLSCGVWVGFDVKRSLGKGEVGARAALPIWIDVMAGALEGAAAEEFVKPPGVEFVAVDKETGLRAADHCDPKQVIPEAFLRGTAPVTYCSPRDHEVRALPYYLQKIYLAGGTLPPPSSGEVAPAATKPYEEHD